MKMSVIRVEKSRNYTVISNVHLRDRELSLKAKGLLSLILSLPANWQYSVNGLAAITKEGRTGVMSALRELERAGYLTRHQLRGTRGRMGPNEYVIRELPDLPQSGNPTAVNPTAVCPTAEYPTAENPTSENRTQINKEEINTERINTDLSKYRFYSFREAAQISAEEMRRERMEYRELILENIEYERLKKDKNLRREDLDEIVELLVDTVCSTKELVVIGGEKKPAEVVKSRFLKLNAEHIGYVLDCMRENTTKIRDIRQYLLTVLYNAPMTMNNYYTALVNHDMKGGGT